ncbi:MAG: winged helix-turn-helix domain-containing protein, partial [bacterium]
KPFAFDELLARIRALIRRASTSPNTELNFEDVHVDVVKRKVKRGDTDIYLSAREFSLLEYLMSHAEKVVSKSEILAHVWGIEFETRTNLIEVYINHLRNTLDCGSRTPLIHTIKGVGYVFRKFDT